MFVLLIHIQWTCVSFNLRVLLNFFTVAIYSLKKLDSLSCRFSHILDFADCTDVVSFNVVPDLFSVNW